MMLDELETIYTIIMAIAESESSMIISKGIFIYLILAGFAKIINPIRKVIVKYKKEKKE